jgi:inhibitor of cysteine peptidase
MLVCGAALLALAVSGCASQPPVTEEPAAPTSGPDAPVSSGDTPEPTGAVAPTAALTSGEAMVESIEILILESFPVQVTVIARGNLPDGCTTIGPAVQQVLENTITVTLTTVRPADAVCTEALTPFEQSIPLLDVVGLPAGTYTVNVNGVTDTFELAVDNILPTEQP